MRSRHQVDTSLRFNPDESQPEFRQVEDPELDPIPDRNPRMVTVAREPYIASSGLADAVNLAIALGRPLLLQGDPGTGKTRLAHAVSYALGLPLEEAYVKSTSRAQDLLYTYDAVRRLYDAQLPPPSPPEQPTDADGVIRTPQGPGAQDPSPPTRAGKYVRLGPLGRAIERAEYGRRSVVLIDEIDKADIDFPNDLLHELDRLTFDIPEAKNVRFAVPADNAELRPVVIVTNNEEKTLPAAFLRRCVFHYIEFPRDSQTLAKILALHGIADMRLREQAIDVLLRLRGLDLSKKPSLSELLDWVGYLQAVGTPADELADFPYLGALVKQRMDEIRVRVQLAPQ